MKAVIDADIFCQIVNDASSIVKRSPAQIVTCMLVRIERGELVVRATDLAQFIEISTDAIDAQADGQIALVADPLRAIAQSLRGTGAFKMELKDSTTQIVGRSAKHSMPGMPGSEFPDFPGSADAPALSIPSADLCAALRFVEPCVCRESAKAGITGALLKANAAGGLDCVGTNGKTLAVYSIPMLAVEPGFEIVLPASTIDTIIRLGQDDEGTCSIQVFDKIAVLSFYGWRLATNLVEGTFPPYLDILPKSRSIEFAMPAAELAAAFNQASLLTTDASYVVVCNFAADGSLTIAGGDAASLGRSEIRVQIAGYSGPAIRIGLSAPLLREVLGGLGGTIHVAMTSPKSPVEFRAGENAVRILAPAAVPQEVSA